MAVEIESRALSASCLGAQSKFARLLGTMQYTWITYLPATAASLGFDGLISDTSRQCDSYEISGNIISNSRGRGILTKSSNGLIANNIITNVKFYGIVLGESMHIMLVFNSRP